MRTYIISDCDNTVISNVNGKLTLEDNTGVTALTEACVGFTPCAVNNSLNIVASTEDDKLIIYDTYANSELFHTTDTCRDIHIMSCKNKLNLVYALNNELILKSKSYGGYISGGCTLARLKCGTSFRAAGYGNRSIIFFVRCMPEQQLGFIELGASYIGSFRLIYSTGYSITDYSLYVEEDILMAAVLVNKGLTSAIVFVRIDNNGTYTRPVYEGMGITLSHIAYSQGNTAIYWQHSRRLCTLVSPDMGKSFYRMEDKPKTDGCRAAVINILDNSIGLREIWYKSRN
jgi:hypothetical protein